MARLYSDEDFPLEVVKELRRLGHDVRTAQEQGQANRKVPDHQVLAHAISLNRAVLTLNRRHYIRLHTRTAGHCGIIVCTKDDDLPAFVQRLHQAILAHDPLDDKLLRVNKPARSPKP